MYECHKLDTQEQVFFYEQDFYVLSNFSAFNVRISDPYVMGGYRTFPTAEHAYHFQKFNYFSEDAERLNSLSIIQEAIIRAPSAHEAFKRAQEYKTYYDPNWDSIKEIEMYRILIAKVEQHEYVKRKLLQTGDRELVEDSWRDDYWGWGPNKDGKNILGKLWMRIRSELQQQAKS